MVDGKTQGNALYRSVEPPVAPDQQNQGRTSLYLNQPAYPARPVYGIGITRVSPYLSKFKANQGVGWIEPATQVLPVYGIGWIGTGWTCHGFEKLRNSGWASLRKSRLYTAFECLDSAKYHIGPF